MLKMDIRGINDTPMRVILLRAGEKNKNFPAATDDDHAIVEFYDQRYDHTPDGQFISRYHAEDMIIGHTLQGLDLLGYVPDWKINGRTRTLVSDWISYHTYTSPGSH